MTGVATEESGAGRSIERASNEQQYQAGEALAEWRSSEQVENGTPSTSPPYWDSDDNDDGGPKPSELYGKYTWKIDKFSQINKRELRSNAFEVGGYKWYILIYPQGCDVCNHLSLFLCVANHDKLLPGWSHFAQFTIAVVNKDPKKSKYSDTLHRFWKKEHDWGWKKFMELSKVLDGFIDGDTLIIKAQVQVIRERADRPFRCLDCQYRRELVRVYLTNVEQICRRFVEERRGKLAKLIEDKARWSSFCAFWGGMDTSSQRRMSREKTESILKVVVKHFFIEKEVTSTLVMDSLYSGLKALEGQYKGKKNKGKHLEAEELPVPIVRMEKDAFVLVDDVLPLLERAAMEPLPPKDEKGPQNRTKDGAPGEEFNKDSIERDERRLTELGRRTIEIFILAHIFSKIEVAYQEAVALKRQEELIREEEAAWLAEIEHKARRGAVDKEKKSKKKQGKQKRNNRKGKDKGREDKPGSNAQGSIEQEYTVESEDVVAAEPEMVIAKSDVVEDVSDVSDSVDILPLDSEDRDVSPVNWDTDTSEVHPPTEASSSGISGLSSVQNGTEGRSSSVVDDSSSTCSSDSVPYVSITRSNSRNLKNQKSPSRARNHQSMLTSVPADWVNKEPSLPFEAPLDAKHTVNGSRSSKAVESLPQAADFSSQDKTVNGVKWHLVKKEEKTRGKDVELSGAASLKSPSGSPSKNIPSIAPSKPESKANTSSDPHMGKKPSSGSPRQVDISACLANSAEIAVTSKPDVQKLATPKPTSAKPSNIATEKLPLQHAGPTSDSKPSISPASVMSRPLSAPVIPAPRPAVSAISMVQTAPILARSASATGRLAPEPTQSSYIPQSYRNAIMGGPVTPHSYTPNHSAPSAPNMSIPSYPQAPPLHVSAPLFSHSDRMDPVQQNTPHFYGIVSNHHHNHHHDTSQNAQPPPPSPLWMEPPPFRRDSSRMPGAYTGVHSRQNHVMGEEFPHLDIINDLLDDEHGIGNLAVSDSGYRSFANGPHYLNRHFSFPGGEPGVSNGPGPSMGPCRFERTRTYPDEGFQYGYGGLGNSYAGPSLGEFIPQQASHGAYANGQIDGLIPNNQWQMGGSDQPFMGVRNADSDGYPYHVTDYQNLSVGVNGYTVFRPSNGL